MSGTPKTRGGKGGAPSIKSPCGHCKKECASGNSIPCGFCEFWFHSECVDGMTAEFVASCDAINRLTGGSSFLCVICRKLSAKINGSMQESIERIKKLEQRLVTADLERKCLTEKINAMETQNRQVNENVMKIETEVATRMEKAKEEVKGEMRSEMQSRDDKKENIVLHGVVESKETDMERNRNDDLEVVKKVAAEIGVELKGEVKVRYRSGRIVGEKPRPMIVEIKDEETRESMLAKARLLAGKEEWKRVFVSPDWTWRQREQMRKDEDKMREDAVKRTEEAKNEGKEGKWMVVGRRGRRWTKWVEERERAE